MDVNDIVGWDGAIDDSTELFLVISRTDTSVTLFGFKDFKTETLTQEDNFGCLHTYSTLDTMVSRGKLEEAYLATT